jgi:hypothetical protein
MLKISLRLALVAVALVAGTPAMAQEALPFRLSLDRFVLLAGGEGLGTERVVVPGDEILRTGVGYANTARLDGPLSLSVAGLSAAITTETDLLEAGTMSDDTRARVGAQAVVFCGPALSTENPAPTPNVRGSGRRFDEAVYPCFVDRDRDGRLEAVFLMGTRWPADRRLQPITPAAYSQRSNIPLPESNAWITFEQGAALQGPVLELHLRLFGTAMNIAAVRLGPERTFFPIERTVRRSAYPHTIVFGGAQVAVLGFEPEGRRLRIRPDHGFDTALLDWNLISRTIFIYR